MDGEFERHPGFSLTEFVKLPYIAVAEAKDAYANPVEGIGVNLVTVVVCEIF